MFERLLPRLLLLGAILLAGPAFVGPLSGQEPEKPVERAKIAISFLPPPLETATYSLGIYDAKTHKLVRHLHEFASEGAFTVGLNGLITGWDAKDDNGKAVPPGQYAARGYAVGALKVEGKAILGNDWASEDENLRVRFVEAIALVPEDEGLIALAYMGNVRWELLRLAGSNNDLLWHSPVGFNIAGSVADVRHSASLDIKSGNVIITALSQHLEYRVSDGHVSAPFSQGATGSADPASASSSPGKNGTVWKIEEGVVGQYFAQGERLRSLAPKDGEPVPVAIAASKTSDRFFLLEESKDVQRVRGLAWKGTTQEGDKAVSTWSTFFENSIHLAYTPVGPDNTPLTAQVEVALVENPLSPGKPERLKLAATFDAKGSYLATADGLRLRQISQRPNLRAAKLARTKGANLSFYQGDGAAWDEFSIEGAKEMMSFDAGEFELTASGEKPAEKPVEPDL